MLGVGFLSTFFVVSGMSCLGLHGGIIYAILMHAVMRTSLSNQKRESAIKNRKFPFKWSHPADSNRRPPDYESGALPAELGWLKDINNRCLF